MHCGLRLNKKKWNIHINRRHSLKITEITDTRHLSSQCIDPLNGIFAVQKSFHTPCCPIHVQKKIAGPSSKVVCEIDECNTNIEFAARSWFVHFECVHLKSLQFSPWSETNSVTLEENVLTHMGYAKIFGEQTKTACINRKEVSAAGVPFTAEVTVGSPSTKKYISVFEPKLSYYTRLGRVIAAYDSRQNTWHCPCVKARRSCIHKNISKWHLFQTDRKMFESSESTEEHTNGECLPHTVEDAAPRDSGFEYPPNDEGLKRMVSYLLKNKTIPPLLPQKLTTGSKTVEDFPKHLIPKETTCPECTGIVALSEPKLITDKAKLVTYTDIVEGISTYCKMCSNCGLSIRYQEWIDGIHNFNDHLLISLHMCLVLRHSLQTHHAVEVLEATTQKKFPSKERILHAYMHFEALTEHDYMYSCIKCGYYPAVTVMDLHKKAVCLYRVEEKKKNR
ncbi:uncharacterized protein LOC143476705 [Brachyhypopomus gauderio]|uniref:uncharacterized protein LOC143476705 n=1 Tax=Brachyhypopomus gauderio TaxID=698409 RepID=UPI004043833C